MSKSRIILMAGGTLVFALSIGFVMQYGGKYQRPEPQQAAMIAPAPVIAARVAPRVETPEPLPIRDIVLTSAQTPDIARRPELPQPVTQQDSTPLDDLTLPAAPADPVAPELGCDITATATPAPLAHAALTVTAPCLPNERVTIHHSGMMFTEVTDADGALTVSIPALSARPIFIADFGEGRGAVATAQIPDLDAFDRVVVQWAGAAGFQIHAREYGAGYGDRGHVWSGGAQGAGQVTALGTSDVLAPKRAEVYSIPAADSTPGTIALSIETEVTQDNCGRDISAQTLELREGQSLRTRDVKLSMPNCAAIGDFLVLNNLVDDLKIAAK